MALLKRVKDISKVASEFRKHYKKEGGWFVLNLEKEEGDDEDEDPAPDVDDEGEEETTPKKEKGDNAVKAKIKEMRANNIKLLKKVEELEGKLSVIDPEMIEAGKKAVAQARSAEERALLQAGDLKGVVDLRLAELKEGHKKEIDKLSKALTEAGGKAETFRDELRGVKIAHFVLREAAKAKLSIEPTAHEDLVRRALDVYDIDDKGQIVALDEEGQPRLNSEQEDFRPVDFFQDVVENAPHLLGRSQGADINGQGGGRRTGRNGVIEIDANDPRSFGKNIEKIAKGEVTARITQSS